MKKFMIEAATILFDDTKNDLRCLPKVVRLQLLTVLSFIWSTAFTLYVWGLMATNIWLGLVIGHMAVIFAAYYTFKQFHNIRNDRFQCGGYHSLGRSRNYVWTNGKKVRLPDNDPGGEHE